MKKHMIRMALAVALSLLILLPLAAGCESEPTAEKEIRIGVIGGLTGPAASVVVPLMDEIENVFRYTNEVDGGIDNAKLNWRIVDNKGTPDGAIIAYKELRDTFAPLLYVVVEDYYLSGIKDMIAEDKAVMLTLSAIDSRLFVPPGRFFSMSIDTADGFAGYIKWVLENWQGAGQPKVGVLYWDLPSGALWRMAEGWARKQGVDLVHVTYPITAIDLKPQLLQFKEAKVDYIWMMGIAPNAAVAIRDARGLGLEIPFTFNEYVESNVVLAIAGAGAEGFYVYRAESPFSDETEAAKLYNKIGKWANDTNEDRWSDNRILLTVKAAIEAAVKQAVDDVGWDNLDSEAIYNALTKLPLIKTWGNMKDFGFGPSRRVGVSTIKIAQFTATGTVSISDWITLPRIFEGIDK